MGLGDLGTNHNDPSHFSDELHRSVDERANGPGACVTGVTARAREEENTATRTLSLVHQATGYEVCRP